MTTSGDNSGLTLPPSLSAADLNGNGSVLSDILGLSPPSSSESPTSVRTYQCGEFKYPDVSSPLNRILSKSKVESPPNHDRDDFLVRNGSVSPADSVPATTSETSKESITTESSSGVATGSPIEHVDMDVISELLRSLSLQHEVHQAEASLPTTDFVDFHRLRNHSSCTATPTPIQGGGDYEPRDFLIGQGRIWSNENNPAADGLGTDAVSLERAARFHRSSAALNEATYTWSGHLPPRSQRNSGLSCKVFLGGVPWDITEASLLGAFKSFGNVKIEWPGKDNSTVPKGYLYIVFEHEKQVRSLLQACTHDYGSGGSWYFKVSSRRMRNKEVQVIPWVIADSGFVRCQSQRLDPQKTVFVGALHGMLNAEGLSNIFNDLFGGVVYAGIDTDKHKYPIGSARVTFNNYRSYMKAVSAAFIEIKTPKFTKKVQVDPYLEDALCTSCQIRQGPYFCRDLSCFKYFCRSCWEVQHEFMVHHKPLMRNCKHNLPRRSYQPTSTTYGVGPVSAAMAHQRLLQLGSFE